MKQTRPTRLERKRREKDEHAIDSEAILGYQRHRVGAALPWDHERHAVNAPWAKLSGDIGPRDSGRGIRSGI